MKKVLLSFFVALALSLTVAVAQTVDQPQFPGGHTGMRAWVASNLQAPPEAAALQNPRVKVTFNVELDGTLSNVTVVDDVPESVKAECLRLVAAMPAWTPGKLDGEPIIVTTTTFINFRPGKVDGSRQSQPVAKDSVDAEGNVWTKPQFAGGRNKFYAYIGPRLVVDPHYKDYNQRHGAEVVVEFKVAKDGAISGAKIISSTYKELNKKSIDIVNGMPNWTPGTKNGKPVEMKHSLRLRYN